MSTGEGPGDGGREAPATAGRVEPPKTAGGVEPPATAGGGEAPATAGGVEPPRRGRTVEEWVTTVGTYAGALAALAGFVYLVGGLVMWLRFRTADLPADQGVAVMSKEQLFVVGLRLMVLPLLVTGTIAVLLADRAAHERGSLRGAGLAALLVLAALLPVWAFAVAGWPVGLAVLLVALVFTGAACVMATLRRPAKLPRWLAPATAATAALLVVVLCLAVPAFEIDDDALPRLAVAAGALVAMVLPGAVLAARGLPRPRPLYTWIAIAVLAVVAGMIVADTWWVRLVVLLGGLVVAGAAAALVLTQGPPSQTARSGPWAAALLAVALVGLLVPWSFASATWPLGLALVVAVWLWRRRGMRAAATPAEVARERRRLTAAMAAAAVVAAAVVSIGRQLDEPVQLLHATVTFAEGAQRVEGAYVSASGDTVYIGDQASETLEAIPRSQVRTVSLGPPADRAPSASLLSRIVPGETRFSARPLEVWCNGERYGWFEAGKLCRTQPELLWTTREHHRFMERLGMPVRVSCPEEARDVCRGWVLLTSRERYLHGRAGIPRPVIAEPVPFAVSPTRNVEVCAPLTAGQLQLLHREGGDFAIPFEAVLAEDPEGETVLAREYYGLLAGPVQLAGNVSPAYSACQPTLSLRPETRPDGVRLRVVARPRARGITPWRVEGAVRLTAKRAVATTAANAPEPPVRPVGRRELSGGEAVLAAELPPGRWIVTARYTSAAGVSYEEPSPDVVVTVPRSAPPPARTE